MLEKSSFISDLDELDHYFYDPSKGKHLMLTYNEFLVLRNLVKSAFKLNPSSELKQILFQLS